MIPTCMCLGALVLAFANGANDNAKGVATLIGGGTMPQRRAIRYAAVTTLLGSVAAVVLATGLVTKFSGKGLVDDAVVRSAAFPASVALAAAVTVLLATRLGMPISTTHALVGAIVGVGATANAVRWPAIVDAFVVPLAAAPVLAAAATAAAYVTFRFAAGRLGVSRETCVCIERQYHPVQVGPDGAVTMIATGVRLHADARAACEQRYLGRMLGVDAQRLVDWGHTATAGAISFARGLNDTPKMAALLIAGAAVSRGLGMAGVGAAIALGGLLAVRRVAVTVSHRITSMNDGQAFTGNLMTALLVIFASRFGMPVSTTHVSCGALFGIGAVNRQAHWRMIGRIIAAWVTTLPCAALLGMLAWQILNP